MERGRGGDRESLLERRKRKEEKEGEIEMENGQSCLD